MGMDTFYEIATWKEIRNFFSLTNFIVTSRPGFPAEGISLVFKNPVFQGLSFFETGEGKVHGCRSFKAESYPCSIFFFETPPIPVSSTEIRERIGEGKYVSGYLPKEVEEYISKNGIYKVAIDN
jgi:nicotinate-nucleotide adenylyltransferase